MDPLSGPLCLRGTRPGARPSTCPCRSPYPLSKRPWKWGCRRLARVAGAAAPRSTGSGAAPPRACPWRASATEIPPGTLTPLPHSSIEGREVRAKTGAGWVCVPAHGQVAVEERLQRPPPMQSNRGAFQSRVAGAAQLALCESHLVKSAVGVAVAPRGRPSKHPLGGPLPREGGRASQRQHRARPVAARGAPAGHSSGLDCVANILDTWTLPTPP